MYHTLYYTQLMFISYRVVPNTTRGQHCNVQASSHS